MQERRSCRLCEIDRHSKKDYTRFPLIHQPSNLLLHPRIFCRYLTGDIFLLCFLYIFLCGFLCIHAFQIATFISRSRRGRWNCVFLAQLRYSSDSRSGLFCRPYLRRRHSGRRRRVGRIGLGLFPILAFLRCP
jgi:hypothetical protein